MKRANEPVFWLLFASGGMATAMVLPAVLIVMVFLLPLNLTAPDALSFDRVNSLSGSWFGLLVWFFLITLPAWHGLHRLLHLTQDFKWGHKKLFSWLFYGLAAFMTVATFTLLVVIS